MNPALVRGWIVLTLALGACAQNGGGTAPPAQNAAPAEAPLSTVTNVTVNGQRYATPAAALEALRQTSYGWVDAVPKEPSPLIGKALVVVPDRDRMRPLMTQQLEAKFKRQVTGQALDFYIDEERLQVRALADALAKAAAFETVTVVEQNETLNPDMGDANYLVWYQVRTAQPDNAGPWLARWQVKRAGNNAVAGAAVDLGVAPGTPRYASFVKSVREGAMRLGATADGAGLAGGKGRRTIGSGSGIIVDAQGHVVTNNHVVAACADIRVVDAANDSTAATIAARDGANDLALLKAARHWPAAASLGDTRAMRAGDKVVVTGYPLGTLLGSNMAVTTGSLTALSGPQDDSRMLQVTAPVQPGNSGGPLLDGAGDVIGVVTGTLNGTVLAIATGALPQNVNFAIKSTLVRNFLDANHVAYAAATRHGERSDADIGELARKFTVRIECRQ